jgi:hypothetical protein
MNFILDSPYVLVNILQEWIALGENLILNSAICNNSLRSKLIFILAITANCVAEDTFYLNNVFMITIHSKFRKLSWVRVAICSQHLEIEVFHTTSIRAFKYARKTALLHKSFNILQFLSKVTKRFSAKSSEFYKFSQEIVQNNTEKTFSLLALNRNCCYFGLYFGECFNGLRHGHGRFHFHDGTTFEGIWKNDFMFYGTYKFKATNKVYTGHFVDSHINGEGI